MDSKEKEVKNKWAKVAKTISKKTPLTDLSKDFIKLSQKFRNNFELKSPV